MRGKNVSVGDYPERDILDEVSDDETEETAAASGDPSTAAPAEDEDEI